jgi:flagellar hook assembly protein FlgD
LPNLFTENTDIFFSITETASVKLVVYNTSGQIVRTLVDKVKTPGQYHIEFNGTDDQGIDLPVGIYFCSMKTAEFRKVKKIILAR